MAGGEPRMMVDKVLMPTNKLKPRKLLTPEQSLKRDLRGVEYALNRPKKRHSALVLFSGGLDSGAALLYAKHRYRSVVALFIQYGQKSQEYFFARDFCSQHDTVILTSSFTVPTESALVTGKGSDFFPGRNQIMISMAVSVAAACFFRAVVLGVGGSGIGEDCPVYPDVSERFLKSLAQTTLQGFSGVGGPVLDFPFIFMSKTAGWMLAEKIGGSAAVRSLRENTTSCYRAFESGWGSHAWGTGCGECPGCQQRESSWLEYERRRDDSGRL